MRFLVLGLFSLNLTGCCWDWVALRTNWSFYVEIQNNVNPVYPQKTGSKIEFEVTQKPDRTLH